MEEEASNPMNVSLNLGLNDDSSNDAESDVDLFTHDGLNSEYWLGPGISGISEAVRPRRREPWRPLWRQLPVSPVARDVNDVEGGVVSGDESKSSCDKNDVVVEDESLGKDDGDVKGERETGSFFDCNVCLELANDPVVTCCGHLFCWTCIYKWLHLHSYANECPVCKGEVTLKNVTPIYGRGESSGVVKQTVEDLNLKIPTRPQAQRVESWRQGMQRPDFSVLRRLVNRRLYRPRDQSQADDDAIPDELPGRNMLLINHIQAHRALRRERNAETSSHENPANSEAGESSQVPSPAYYQRMNLSLAAVLSNMSARGSADTLGRNQEPTQGVEDRDSVSSIAAVIQSESQTVDTPVDNDSTVLLSTSSSSRRRNNASRVSDVNSGDSRSPRRRRLN